MISGQSERGKTRRNFSRTVGLGERGEGQQQSKMLPGQPTLDGVLGKRKRGKGTEIGGQKGGGKKNSTYLENR